jgi:hypothetical protein
MKKYLFVFFVVISVVVSAQNSIKDDFRIQLQTDSFLINTYSAKTLYIIADSTPIYKNAKIKVIFPKFFGDYAWDNMLWILIPPNLRAGYMQARSLHSGKRAVINAVTNCYDEFQTTPSSFFDYKFAHENNQRMVTIEMLDTLPVGDTLQLIYGANGSATFTYNSMVAHSDNFSVLLDNRNNGVFTALKDQPELVFKHAAPKNINIALASTAKSGQPALLKLMLNDIGKNRTPNFSGTIQLSCSDPNAVFPSIVAITPADSGVKDVYVTFNTKGIFSMSSKVMTSNFPVTGSFFSNPILISDDSINIYWGDFHTHTKFSRDGFGSEGYLFARNGAGHDFYSGTDHSDFNQTDTFGINTKEWNTLQQEALRYNQPNRFVTFLGYENSLDNPSGHYNFIYNFEDSLVHEIPMLAKNPLFAIQNFWTKLNQANQQKKVLSIPHHTGKLFGSTGPDNGASQFGGNFVNKEYKRLIEIYSGHGLGEYYNPNHNLAYDKFGGRDTKFPCFAQDAWAIGERLGVIASTDSHNGTPSQTNVGLAAILSDSLNRNKLFTNLYNRHSYATTGEKIILKFTMDKAIMGDEMSVACDSFPTIQVNVIGTDVLDFIEVLKWDFKKGTYTTNPVHPIYKIIKKVSFSAPVKNHSFAFIDTSMQDSCLYYVRVKQKNMVSNREVWAWSSPIWVNKIRCDSTALRTDSFYNFNLTHIAPGINVNWCMQDELNTNYFVVERKNTNSTAFSSLETIYTAHIAFKDSCYTFKDIFPDDTVMYYRIKIVSYTDSIRYSDVLAIRIPYVRDSVYDLNASVLSNKIDIQWKAKEYFAQYYNIQKRTVSGSFQNHASVSVNTALQDNAYSHPDFYPLKDTSYYRLIMNLQNGTFKISNLDTIVFRIDSLIKFKVVKNGNDTATASWQGVHEQGVVRYELQRSQDRTNFLTIHTTLPSGNLFDTATYQYQDTSMLTGWNYYRVVQIMLDGSSKLSQLDSVRQLVTGIQQQSALEDITELKILDNLLEENSSNLNFFAVANKTVDGTFLIAGIDGKQYYQQNYRLLKGKSTGSLQIGGLSTGVYYLLFISNELIIKNSFIVAFHGGCVH